MITHDDAQFARAVNLKGAASTLEQAITFIMEVAARPTLMMRYTTVLTFADFMIVTETS